jgi:hypothetical protein
MLYFHTFVILSMLCFHTSCCTLTINNVQSRGIAEDVVDSDPINDIKPSTDLTIPAIGL